MSAARTRWRAIPALAAVAALVLAACSPGPPPSASPAAHTNPPPATDAAPSAVALADALRGAVDPASIVADLARLETITLDHGGTRPAGSEANAAAAAFVADELRAMGYRVTLHEIVVPLFSQVGPGALTIDAPHAPTFEGGTDFKPVLFSTSGSVTAPIFALGFDPAAEPEEVHGLGCAAGDWARFPPGSIALVQPGRCPVRIVVDHAQEAGAVGLVRSLPGWTPGRVLRPTLIDPDGVSIPVVGATHAVGLALNEAADEGQAVHLASETAVVERSAASVVADSPGGDPGHVLMLGAHLDGVIDGPGINDNGSGAMTILEIARRLVAPPGDPATAPAWQVRFAFWTGEEIGLWGSTAYVDGLDPASLEAVEAYLNFDMLGSVNGVRFVYDHGPTGGPGAAAITGLFGRAFDDEGLTWAPVPAGGSDDASFDRVLVPTGGLFAGHNSRKTEDQVEAFGGALGELLDPCYHLPCDTLDNVDPELLGQMVRAAAWVTGYLAAGQTALEPGI